MTTQGKLISLLACALALGLASADADPLWSEDLSASYTWKPMKIGGGGWVTGLDISPSEAGLVYVRTDVSGAYRWQPDSAAWKQLVTTASMPAGVLEYGNYTGVESLVGAPGNPDVAYMAFTAKPYQAAAVEIYKSTNRGDTWWATGFRQHSVKTDSNGEGRQEGERLAVDPANSEVVYYGSISGGLWTTANGGAEWRRRQVAPIPSGRAPHGVNTVVFDPGSGQSAGKTSMIYVTVDGEGVFQTEDAGETWREISISGPHQSRSPRDAAIGPDRNYYVAYEGKEGEPGAIWKHSPSGEWTDITPPGPEGGSKAWWAITVDPHNPQHLLAMIHGGRAFVSEDQGASWKSHGFRLTSPDVAWQGRQENYFLSVGELAFDHFTPGGVWFAEGFGVWQTQLPAAGPDLEWRSVSRGIEETCGNDVIAPPGGQPVAAMWDVGAMYFADVDQYSSVKSHPTFMSAWALDWCAADPKFIAGVFHNHLEFGPKPRASGFSTDGGRTWSRFAALEDGSASADLKYGVIAVAADSPDNLVWAPSGGKLPYFTKNRGATWIRCDLGDVTATDDLTHYSPQKPLCADRVLPGTFYFYTSRDGFFRSGDGGATFQNVGPPVPERWNIFLKTAPGQAGHLWFADGSGKGLRQSTDGGETFLGTVGLQKAFNFGFGASEGPGNYPALYVVGVQEGQHGIYRTTNQALTWDRIGEFPLGITDSIDALDGDKDVFGKVYVAFAGAGFVYGVSSQ